MAAQDHSRHFDAFISYRHRQPDMRVAEKIQSLLERYRVPRGMGRSRLGPIFRDKSELPTGNDLGESLREALRNSSFLIVVLSEETKDSKWCMEEIRYFKELHGGRVNHILPVLVSGEPDEALPDMLRFEEIAEIGPDGSEATVTREIEPLIGDVRAKTDRGRMKKLRTEYLRLAAQILGCHFDALYQRQRRHERRVRTAVGASAFAILTVTLAVISLFAYRTHVSERQYRKSLAAQLVQRGAESYDENDIPAALMYYTRALEVSPSDGTAAAGAALALQSTFWVSVDEAEAAAPAEAAQETAAFEAPDRCGALLSAPEDNGQNIHVYQDGLRLTIFAQEERHVLSVSVPEEANPNLSVLAKIEDPVESGHRPFVRLARQGEALGIAVTYAGYLYFYAIPSDLPPDSETPVEGELAWTLDLSKAFSYEIVSEYLGFNNPIEVSPNSGLAVIRDGSGCDMCTVDLFERRVLSGGLPIDSMPGEILGDTLVVSPEGDSFAFFGTSGSYDGAYNEAYIMGADGTPLVESYHEYRDAPVCLRYDGTGQSLLVVRQNSVSAYNLETGVMMFPVVPVEAAADGRFDEQGQVEITDESGKRFRIRELGFCAAESDYDETPTRIQGDGVYRKDDEFYTVFDKPQDATCVGTWVNGEMILTADGDESDPCLRLLDASGAELDRLPLPDPSLAYFAWVDGELPVAYFTPKTHTDALYRCGIDVDARKLGEVEQLETRGAIVSGPIYRLGGGCAFYTPDMQVYYYPGDALEPSAVSELGNGMLIQDVDQFAGAGTGRALLMMIRFIDGDYHMPAEFWDFGAGLCLGKFDFSQRIYRIGNLTNGDVKIVGYDYVEQTDSYVPVSYKHFCLDVPAVDRKLLDTLYALCRKEWSDAAVTADQVPRFTGEMGSWTGRIKDVSDARFQPVGQD